MLFLPVGSPDFFDYNNPVKTPPPLLGSVPFTEPEQPNMEGEEERSNDEDKSGDEEEGSASDGEREGTPPFPKFIHPAGLKETPEQIAATRQICNYLRYHYRHTWATAPNRKIRPGQIGKGMVNGEVQKEEEGQTRQRGKETAPRREGLRPHSVLRATERAQGKILRRS